MLKALLLGDAASVWDDVARALELFEPDAVCATSNAGIRWPHRLDYWCTLHITKCPDWVGVIEGLRQRQAAGRNRPQIWAHKRQPGVDRCTADWGGGSGLFAIKVLREERFERIVACGMPMSREGGHFYNDRQWSTAERYRPGWVRHRKDIEVYFRSMSGWTQEEFGEPTPDWFAEQPAKQPAP